ncbi:MAG: SDR family NAD(P)-dependent oxidoreductase, partial [Parachlamydiaceae bacterium]|nr:SDR family NAD(P)-dependent oxidoreductase [Parachlamydiaceae bacterium]
MNKSVKKQFDLTSRVAIITGGGGLLGRKHAEALAEFGCITILADLNKENAKVASSIVEKEFCVRSIPYKCDITNKEEIVALKNFVLSEFGRIDILINNAAIDPKVNNS